MKPWVLLSFLAVSLTANGVLLWLGSPSAPKVAEAPNKGATAARSETSSSGRTGAELAGDAQSKALSEAWSVFNSGDLATLAAQMRKAGLSEKFVRRVIEAQIRESFKARREALAPRQLPKNWWQVSEKRVLSFKTQMALHDLDKEETRMAEQILGPDPDGPARRLPVDPEKQSAAQAILDDYKAMRNALSGAYLTATENAQLSMLDEERRKDLSAILSPEELRRLEIAKSDTTAQLNFDVLAAVKVNEAEFLALHAVRKEFDDRIKKYNASAGDFETLLAIQNETASRYTEILGQERYQAFRMNNDFENQALKQAASRLGVPEKAVQEVMETRDTLLKQGLELRDNDTLSDQEKVVRLKGLAQAAETQILTKLGPELGQSYLNEMKVTESMKKGNVVEAMPFGGWSTMPVSFKRKAKP